MLLISSMVKTVFPFSFHCWKRRRSAQILSAALVAGYHPSSLVVFDDNTDLCMTVPRHERLTYELENLKRSSHGVSIRICSFAVSFASLTRSVSLNLLLSTDFITLRRLFISSILLLKIQCTTMPITFLIPWSFAYLRWQAAECPWLPG